MVIGRATSPPIDEERQLLAALKSRDLAMVIMRYRPDLKPSDDIAARTRARRSQ